MSNGGNLLYTNSSVYELNNNSFNKRKLIHTDFKNRLGLIVVYAHWCPHCTVMVEDIKLLASKLSKYKFMIGAVNGAVHKQLSHNLNVNGFPTLYFVNNGILEEYKGSRNIEAILQQICSFTSSKLCCRKVNNNIIC